MHIGCTGVPGPSLANPARDRLPATSCRWPRPLPPRRFALDIGRETSRRVNETIPPSRGSSIPNPPQGMKGAGQPTTLATGWPRAWPLRFSLLAYPYPCPSRGGGMVGPRPVPLLIHLPRLNFQSLNFMEGVFTGLCKTIMKSLRSVADFLRGDFKRSG